MKTMELLEKLENYPLFTVNDLSRIVMKNKKYVKLVAYRLRDRGYVKHIEKGKYTVHEDPLEFASYINTPSYISFWTALMIHGFTEQLPKDIMIAVPKSKKKINFNGQKIIFTKTNMFWGYGKKRYRKFEIFIADKEKAVIDCLLSKNTPFDEAVKATASGEIDFEKLVNYTIKTKNKSLAKRIGYLIEKFSGDATELMNMVDNNYVVLDKSFKNTGKKHSRWKIIENRKVNDI